tara:strand:- start:200 stop:1063 length:864 start_codon:yes stop_codon:yes gene_type:complete
VNYSKLYKKLNVPWVESPLFDQVKKTKQKNSELLKLAEKFNRNGYVIIDLGLSKKTIKQIIQDTKNLAVKSSTKKNPDIYHYNESPRIIEAYKTSKKIKDLCLNKKILALLKYFYEKKPVPINSINFLRGTDQPLHSDYIHFSSSPHKYLAAAWVALEKTDESNGPLQVVPGSHKLDIVDYSLFGLKKPTTMKELSKFYSVYENYIRDLLKCKKIKTKTIKMKEGQALIWAANILHGGKKIQDKKKTRFSQVTHYHFDKCNFIYNPGFSDPMNGMFAYRNLKELAIK